MDTITVNLGNEKTIVVTVDSLSDVSDGYHTIDELYDHRCLLFILLCVQNKDKACYKVDPNTPGWVILYYESEIGQISYHVPDKFLKYIEVILRRDDGHEWDGHNSQDVVTRIQKCIFYQYGINKNK